MAGRQIPRAWPIHVERLYLDPVPLASCQDVPLDLARQLPCLNMNSSSDFKPDILLILLLNYSSEIT